MLHLAGGVFFIVFGILLLYLVIKYPPRKGHYYVIFKLQGYLWGCISIVFGIILLFEFFSK